MSQVGHFFVGLAPDFRGPGVRVGRPFGVKSSGSGRIHFQLALRCRAAGIWTDMRFRFAGLLGLGLFSIHALTAQVTETPQTVAPGKLRFEIDGLRLAYDRADAAGNKVTGVAVASTIVTAGITESFDVQAGLDLFLRRSVEFRGRRDSRAGIGDLYFRAKWTFWRDQGRGAALAVMPYVKIPSNSAGLGNDAVEGGLIFPWAMKTGEGVTAGAMLRWDMVRNDDDNGYDARWHLSGYVQQDITKMLAAYAEGLLSLYSTGFSQWQGGVGVGLLCQVTKSIQLDYEIMRGLNRRATDWQHIFRVNWDW